MKQYIHTSWLPIMNREFEKEYFTKLDQFIAQSYIKTICYPPKEQLFSAFNKCLYDDVKVVIIGQDPYHGEGQANGLCFSVNEGIKHPPSLQNIFKELSEDLGKEIPKSGNLENWASQGVLLLNALLSVAKSNPESHKNKGWEQFTDSIISELSSQKKQLVFMLWGGYAKQKGKTIDRTKHLVLESGHPSPMSANKGHWFGNKHFSKANEYLIKNNKTPINW